MQGPDRQKLTNLQQIPNIGPAIATDLRLIGIDQPQDLIGKDPFEIYHQLCQKTNQRHDPCVLDVFMAAIDFMNGAEPLAWWKFTARRKKQYANI